MEHSPGRSIREWLLRNAFCWQKIMEVRNPHVGVDYRSTFGYSAAISRLSPTSWLGYHDRTGRAVACLVVFSWPASAIIGRKSSALDDCSIRIALLRQPMGIYPSA